MLVRFSLPLMTLLLAGAAIGSAQNDDQRAYDPPPGDSSQPYGGGQPYDGGDRPYDGGGDAGPPPAGYPVQRGYPAPQGYYADGQSVPSTDVFLEPLSHFGRWVDSRWGRAWSPDVGPDWRPYTLGHWEDSDEFGRTWRSDEPFGWAVYHYGRWGFDQRQGWLWLPDTVWGPAWVAWRDGDDYAGWAPLPPRIEVGFGVASGFDGWGYDNWYQPSWVFVPRVYIYGRSVRGAILPFGHNRDYWGRTRGVTRYDNVGGRIVNRSFGDPRYPGGRWRNYQPGSPPPLGSRGQGYDGRGPGRFDGRPQGDPQGYERGDPRRGGIAAGHLPLAQPGQPGQPGLAQRPWSDGRRGDARPYPGQPRTGQPNRPVAQPTPSPVPRAVPVQPLRGVPVQPLRAGPPQRPGPAAAPRPAERPVHQVERPNERTP